MWKIAVAVMLLATSAFGAVTITLTDADGDSEGKVDPGVPSMVAVDVNVDVGTDVVDGIGLYLASDTPGVRIAERVITGTKLTFKTYDDADVYAMDMLFNPADTSNLKDVGVGQANANAHLLAADPGKIMTLTFAIPALPAGTLVKIASPYALWAPGTAGWFAHRGDGTTIEGSPISYSVVVTPDAAIMLLMAAGAVFFAVVVGLSLRD
jgi:hypothetical protein